MSDLLGLMCFGGMLTIIGLMFFSYKLLSLPVVTNMIYIYYGTKAAEKVIREIKAPPQLNLPELEEHVASSI